MNYTTLEMLAIHTWGKQKQSHKCIWGRVTAHPLLMHTDYHHIIEKGSWVGTFVIHKIDLVLHNMRSMRNVHEKRDALVKCRETGCYRRMLILRSCSV
jgi:hypothetical protein